MAELDTSGGGKKKGGKVRSKKQSTRVDLTAMVDLAFLLITFFMLTTTLAKPQAMDVAMPDKSEKIDNLEVADNRSMTILLGKDNKLIWFMGQIDAPLEGPTVENYGKNGVRQILLEKVKKIPELTGDPKKGLIVLIKPAETSKYLNLVDILDEMKITKVPSFAIVDITDPDIELLDSKNLY